MKILAGFILGFVAASVELLATLYYLFSVGAIR